MKVIALIFGLSLSSSLIACPNFPTELENKSIGDMEELATALPQSGLKVDSRIRALVNKVIELSSECKNSFITAESFLLKNGKLVHLAYTSEDICDGGNSYGVVLDANLNIIASIQDTDFYCAK